MAAASVSKLYYGVIEEVVNGVRDAFIDEGIDEQVLSELKQCWEKKLLETKAIEREPEPLAKATQPAIQRLQQQATNVGPSTSITHHLAMPSQNLVPQALLQCTTAPCSGDLSKTLVNLPQKVTLTLPAHLAQTGLQTLLSAQPGTTTVLTPELASLFHGNVITSSENLQHGGQPIANVQYQTLTSDQLQKAQQFVAIPVTTPQSQANVIGQIDGANDTSDEEEDDDYPDDDDHDDNDDEQNEDDLGKEDEEPLNSNDDVSDEDPTDMFETDNVVVCQYDKITRSKNRWKFHLKDGIMNLQGKDFVFQKAMGDSEW